MRPTAQIDAVSLCPWVDSSGRTPGAALCWDRTVVPCYGWSSRAPEALSPQGPSSMGSLKCGTLLESLLGILAHRVTRAGKSHVTREVEPISSSSAPNVSGPPGLPLKVPP